MKHPRRPYLRPEERPEAFDKLAESWRRHFQPTDPESETLVRTLIYIQWRIERYRCDEALLVELASDNPGQPRALASLRALIDSLQQIGAWTYNSLRFLARVHTLDASEAIDDKAISHNLGSFLQNAPDLPAAFLLTEPPPRTKPN